MVYACHQQHYGQSEKGYGGVGDGYVFWGDKEHLSWNGDKVIELSAPYIKIYGEVAQEYEKRAGWQNYCKILEDRIALLENSN